MKVVFATDDGKVISQHFGGASQFLVICIDNQDEKYREVRNELGLANFHGGGKSHTHSHEHCSQQNHYKHIQIMQAIDDCEVVICSGMGRGAFVSITSLGKQVFVTDISDIEPALKAFQAGNLENMMDLIH